MPRIDSDHGRFGGSKIQNEPQPAKSGPSTRRFRSQALSLGTARTSGVETSIVQESERIWVLTGFHAITCEYELARGGHMLLSNAPLVQ